MTTGQTCIAGAVWTVLVSAALQFSLPFTGRGFTVVADEVRGLSKRTTRFSAQIAAVMVSMREFVDDTESAIAKMASQDMSFALSSKQCVETVFGAMDRMTAERKAAVAQLCSHIDGVGQVAAAAVREHYADSLDALNQPVVAAAATLDAIARFAQRAPVNPKQGVAGGEVELF